MADPLSLLPFALAAGGGTVDGLACRQLVAAGLAIRPRSARIARALGQSAASIRLPPGPAFLAALAACDGVPVHLLAATSDAATSGAAEVDFTLRRYATAPSSGSIMVFLDDVPAAATLRHDGDEQRIDLGSHFALDLAGEREAEGSADVCLIAQRADGPPTPWTHRELLRAIREHAARHGLTPQHTHEVASSWHVVEHLIAAAATLYVGGQVETTRRSAGA